MAQKRNIAYLIVDEGIHTPLSDEYLESWSGLTRIETADDDQALKFIKGNTERIRFLIIMTLDPQRKEAWILKMMDVSRMNALLLYYPPIPSVNPGERIREPFDSELLDFLIEERGKELEALYSLN